MERDFWYLSYEMYEKGIPKAVLEEKNKEQFDSLRRNITSFLITPEIERNINIGINEYMVATGSTKRPRMTGYTIPNKLIEENLKLGRLSTFDYRRRDRQVDSMFEMKRKGFGLFAEAVLAIDFQIDRTSDMSYTYTDGHPVYFGYDYYNEGYFHPLVACGSALTEEMDLAVKLEINGLPQSISSESLLYEIYASIHKDPTGAVALAQIMAMGERREDAAKFLNRIMTDKEIIYKMVESKYAATADSRLAFFNLAESRSKYTTFGTHEANSQRLNFVSIKRPLVKRLVSTYMILMQAALRIPFGRVIVANARVLDVFISRRVKASA